MSTHRFATRVSLAIVGCVASGLMIAAPAAAAPLWPGGPDVPWLPPAPNAPAPNRAAPVQNQTAPQAQTPQTRASATISPSSGEVVGGKRAIDIYFSGPVNQDAPGVSVSSSAGTGGSLRWVSDQHAQWVPNDHWARGEDVTVNAPGATSTYAVSDSLTSVGNINNHTFTVSIGGDVVRTMPASFGKPGFDTPRGTFSVLEKGTNILMDSSTVGIPVDSAEGYRLTVDYGIRLTWGGIYVHSAPWSVGSQGNSNVSHGCINLSTENAAWYYNIVRVGDSVTLQ